MSRAQNQFVWCELMTTDDKAAAEFYRTVIGWTTADAGAADMRYTIVHAGERPVGGIFEYPEAMKTEAARPFWIGYIGVDDVDAFASRVKQAGGGIHREPTDIPAVGRFAIVSDPQGATFTLFKPLGEAQQAPAAPGAPGTVGWHELYAADWEKAFAFYADLFGWTKAETMDMGPMGKYQLFAAGGMPIGGMMNKGDAIPKPAWGYYFNVDDINAAVTRTKSAGGQIVMGPHEVPGGMWIVQGLDPQGATFAMVAPPAK